jgi:hypothetical protein
MVSSSRCSIAAAERSNAELTLVLRKNPVCAAFSAKFLRENFVTNAHEFPKRGLPLCWWLGAIPFILARTMPQFLKVLMSPGAVRPGSPAL